MKNLIILLFAIFLTITLSSCGNKNDDPNTKMDDTARYNPPATEDKEKSNEISQDASSEEKVSTDKPLTEKTPDGIKINFPAGATEVSINGKIDGLNSVTYLMDVSKGQTLIGSIEAVSEAGKEQGNIRFSQIITPSGKADGPFGSSIKYDLTVAGVWKLIVSENQMSGDPWTGDFKMIIGIK